MQSKVARNGKIRLFTYSIKFQIKRRFHVFFVCFQDEFLDIVYWSRQVLGIIIGVFWGAIPLKGFIAIAL